MGIDIVVMNTKSWFYFLQPSVLSAGVACGVGAVLVLVAVTAEHYSNSLLQQTIFNINSVPANGPAATFQEAALRIDSNRWLSNLPLFVLWACVGLAAYFVGVWLLGLMKKGKKMQEALEVAGHNRSAFLEHELVRLAIRLVALVAAVLFAKLIMKKVMPYSLALAHEGARHLLVPGVIYVVAAFALVAVAIHAVVVCTRLVCLKARLFD